MKKALVLLFTFYFLISSVGIVLGQHSCGNKTGYTLWGIPVTKTSGCKCKHKSSPAKHNINCCKSDTKWIKNVSFDTKIQISLVVSKNASVPLAIFFTKLFIDIPKMETVVYKIDHSPPLAEIPLFLQNRLLLI